MGRDDYSRVSFSAEANNHSCDFASQTDDDTINDSNYQRSGPGGRWAVQVVCGVFQRSKQDMNRTVSRP